MEPLGRGTHRLQALSAKRECKYWFLERHELGAQACQCQGNATFPFYAFGFPCQANVTRE